MSGAAAGKQWTFPQGEPPLSEPFECAPGSTEPKVTPRNVWIALRKIGIKVRYNEFTYRETITGLPGFGPVLNKEARNRIYVWLWQIYKLKPGEGDLKTILTDLAQHERYHPVRDYFDRLVWDGKPRLDTWLQVYANAEPTKFLSRVGAITLIAAVRRIRKPGCKFDEMLVLETPTQGTNKTSAWKALAIEDEWYINDLPLTSDTRKVLEQSQGKLIIEAAELVGMTDNTKVINRIKGFMDRGFDTARWAYGEDVSERPRQFILVGSTNELEWLHDKTGNRRFWPVSVQRFDIEALKQDRDQLWAEAAAREAQGESIRLEESLWAAAKVEQDKRMVADALRDRLVAMLDDIDYGKISADDLIQFCFPNRAPQDAMGTKISAAMKTIDGWIKKPMKFGKTTRQGYYKGSEDPVWTIQGGRAVPMPKGPFTPGAGAETPKPVSH